MLKGKFFLLPTLLLACSGPLSLVAAKPQANAEQNEFFESKIRPLLSSKCFACHGVEMKMAGLNLATSAGFFKGGDSGLIVVKGEPENSRLISAVNYQGQIKMPPTGKLKDAEIADLVAWIKIGAPWPDAGAVAVAVEKPKGYQFTEQQKKFWAFQPVKDATPPKLKNASWSKSPLDQFILAEFEKKGLFPARPASKLTLLRRATFDLTGLPPTEKEIADFLADRSPNAFAKVVERLLASPRYGERWGRHWLDVVRYADSAGADEDIRYPYAYRYRDYVLEAFNMICLTTNSSSSKWRGTCCPPKSRATSTPPASSPPDFFRLGPSSWPSRTSQRWFTTWWTSKWMSPRAPSWV
jgi:cytochrome c551/c552